MNLSMCPYIQTYLHPQLLSRKLLFARMETITESLSQSTCRVVETSSKRYIYKQLLKVGMRKRHKRQTNPLKSLLREKDVLTALGNGVQERGSKDGASSF